MNVLFHYYVGCHQRNKNQTEDGWEFPRHRLHVISILGEGCFGQVWKCQALNIAGMLRPSFIHLLLGEIKISSFSGILVSLAIIIYCYFGCSGLEGSSFVAVKTLKESAGDKERQDLLKELQVMKSLKPHPNIVTLLGCCTDKGNPLSNLYTYVLCCIAVLPKLSSWSTCNHNKTSCRSTQCQKLQIMGGGGMKRFFSF